MPEQALGTSENPTFSLVLSGTWLFVVRLIAVRSAFMGALQHRVLCGSGLLCMQAFTDPQSHQPQHWLGGPFEPVNFLKLQIVFLIAISACWADGP